MPGDSTWLLVLGPVAALTGAIVGVAVDPTPVESSRNLSNLLPEQRSSQVAFDQRDLISPEDHHPLEMPHGVVPVEELEAHGRIYGAHHAGNPVFPDHASHRSAGSYGESVATEAPAATPPVTHEAERVPGSNEEENKAGPKIVDVAVTLASYESRY